jgi:hypothetical protein
VSEEFVEYCRNQQNAPAMKPGEMTIREAAETLQLAPMTVHGLIHKGILHPIARPLPTKRGHLQRSICLSRDAVEHLKKERAAKARVKPEPFFDVAGAWLPRVFAKKKYPQIPPSLLLHNAGKPCRSLGGAVLRAKAIEWPNGYRTRPHRRPLGFLEEDLRRIAGLGPDDLPLPERRVAKPSENAGGSPADQRPVKRHRYRL